MMPTVGWTFVTYEKLKPNIKYQLKFGGVAQLGEHLPCKQGGQEFDSPHLHQRL